MMKDKVSARSGTGLALTPADELIIQTFGRLHRAALGIAVGGLTGFVIFSATAVLLMKGGSAIGPNLDLLSQYFIGYAVTWPGSLVGLFYGFASGFIVGWLVAFLRNLFVLIYLHAVKLKANLSSFGDFMDQ